MKTSRYTEAQILAILRQAEGGMPVAELCREHGMSNASFYKWRSKYGGMDVSLISQMKAVEDENRRLKKMFAELSMQNELLNCEGERHWFERARAGPWKKVDRPSIARKANARICRGSTPRDGRNGGGRARCKHCPCLPHLRGQRDLLPLQPASE